MKLLTVVGARPNFMKAAPIIAAVHEHNRKSTNDRKPVRMQHVLVHTGQHYDEIMSGSFFADLRLSKPDLLMGVGSGSHAAQTAEIMRKFEEILLTEKPDAVIVVGDVNSTMACALVASKISFDSHGTRPLIAHVESGLRSFDRSMPEEVNRVLTDHISDLLFVTEESGLKNLHAEGICADKLFFVGNTMIDSLLASEVEAASSTKLDELGLRRTSPAQQMEVTPYTLLTMHRPSNVDNPEVFREILAGLEDLASQCPIIFPVHPRTQKRIEQFGIRFHVQEQIAVPTVGIRMIPAVGYLDFLSLMKHAALVVTDSGGIQEETTCLGVPCVTVRNNTERPVTVEQGTNVLAGTSREGIRSAIRRQRAASRMRVAPPHWDGQAATRIVGVLCEALQRKSVPITRENFETLPVTDCLPYPQDARQS